MNEMTTLDELGRHLDPADAPDLTAARAALTAPAVRRPVTSRRWPIALGGTAVLATALTAALVLVPVTPLRQKPAAQAGAADILQRAARAAAAEPELKARPDQFLYVEVRSDLSFEPATRRNPPPATHGVWASIDGSRPGYFDAGLRSGPIAGCRKGLIIPGDGPVPLFNSYGLQGAWRLEGLRIEQRPGGKATCAPRPAIRADLPTDATGMLRYLQNLTPRWHIAPFMVAAELLGSGLLPPRSRAAMFAALAKLDGTQTRRSADILGRKGIAVTWAAKEMIFDSNTYRYLGDRDLVPTRAQNALQKSAGLAATPPTQGRPSPYGPLKTGDVIYESAILRVAVVDKVRQLPRP